MATRIYLDHAATTPILPEAAAAIGAACAAGPIRPRPMPRAAPSAPRWRTRGGGSRAALGWDGALIFTSGATEAIEIVMRRAKAGPRIVSAIEHPAVLRARPRRARSRPGATARSTSPISTRRWPGRSGRWSRSSRSTTRPASIHPIAEIAARVTAAGGLLLVDCAQSAGKLPLPRPISSSIAAHKLGGPPGIGALLVRDAATLEAVGGQEGGHRPGTAAVPMIMGFAAAARPIMAGTRRRSGCAPGSTRASSRRAATIVAGTAPRIATIAGYRMPGVPAAAQMMQLDLAGIAVSAGSACSSGSLKTSHVLAAMGMDEEEAREVIRVSFGPSTSESDIDALLAEWRALFARRRAA